MANKRLAFPKSRLQKLMKPYLKNKKIDEEVYVELSNYLEEVLIGVCKRLNDYSETVDLKLLDECIKSPKLNKEPSFDGNIFVRVKGGYMIF